MSETSERVERVRALLSEQNLDCMLITHPSNRVYLTGFTGEDIAPNESSGHLFITPSDAVLVTGGVNTTQAAAQAPHVRVVKREGGWPQADVAILTELGAHRIGYEAQAMLVGVFHGISEQLNEKNHQHEWVAADGLVEQLRVVKSASEIALLRKAFEITSEAFNRVAPTIEAGQTEWDVAWRIHQAFVELGAEGPAFPTIVAAGTHAARPHHEPGERVIREGEPIVIDMGAQVDGYSADLTRTIIIGQSDSKFRERYASVLEAQLAALSQIRPGMTGRDADAIAREALVRSGLGEAFVHGLGHGVGLLVHESPSLGTTSTDVLQPGEIVTIEPGIYEEGWGGIRIEDLCVVSDSGLDVLSAAAK